VGYPNRRRYKSCYTPRKEPDSSRQSSVLSVHALYIMTKEGTIRRQHDGSRQLHQRVPLDFKELTSSSFVRSHRRERNVTWNRTRSLFCRLVVALSMIAVTAGHSERSPLNLDLEADFFNAVESSHQTFDDTYHPEKGRRLQNDGTLTPFIPPTFPPFTVQPITPLLLNSKSFRARRFDI
jgi:hypothetical protein